MKQTAFLLVLLLAQPGYADDWGCQVMLCMSNPAGPMAVAECVPPMQRLYEAMSHKGFHWPTCDLAAKPETPKPFAVDPSAKALTDPAWRPGSGNQNNGQ